MPVLPGVVFLVPAILLIGPHDPGLRRVALLIRMVLRRASRVKHQRLRQIGRFAHTRYNESRRLVRAHLHQHQDGKAGWRTHLPLLAITLIGLTASAGIMFAVWRTIP